MTIPSNFEKDKVYNIKIKHFHRHFNGDESYEINIIQVLGQYVHEWIMNDFHNITLAIY